MHAPPSVQEFCAGAKALVRGGRGAFQPAADDVVADVALPRLLPTAEQLSDRFCALRAFHPRKVCADKQAAQHKADLL